LPFIIASVSGAMPSGSGSATSAPCASSTSTQALQFSRAAYSSGVSPPVCVFL
jgi:hypothetical protein